MALSGSAYAATALPANGVTSVQVKNHSLLGADFRSGRLPAGKKGAAGPRGPAGTFSASNVSAALGPITTLCGGFQAVATCASAGVSPRASSATVDLGALQRAFAQRLVSGGGADRAP